MAKLQVQTQIMHQNLAIILWQLCYGIFSFIILVPGGMVMTPTVKRFLRGRGFGRSEII